MATLIAEANIYSAFKLDILDGNLEANLYSQSTLELVDTLEIAGNDVVQLRLRKGFEADLETTATISCQGGFLFLGGVAKDGDLDLLGPVRNTGLKLEVDYQQYVDPTYIRIDLDALMNEGLPEQTDITLAMEEGWVEEDRYKYPSALGYKIPANSSYLTVRTPARARAVLPSIVASIDPDFPYRLRYFNNDNNVTVYSLFTPTAFAVGNFVGEIASGIFTNLSSIIGAIYPEDIDPIDVSTNMITDNTRARYLLENAQYDSAFTTQVDNLILRLAEANFTTSTTLTAQPEGLLRETSANLQVTGSTLAVGKDLRLFSANLTATSTLSGLVEVGKFLEPLELTATSSLEAEGELSMVFEVDRNLLSSTTIQINVPPNSVIDIDWGDGNIQSLNNNSSNYYSLQHTYTQNATSAFVKAFVVYSNPGSSNEIQIQNVMSTSYAWLKGIVSYGSVVDVGSPTVQPCRVINYIQPFYVPNKLPEGTNSLRYQFYNNQGFNDIGITYWDTSNIENTEYCFFSCRDFNQDISGWDVGSVTNMAYMFNGAWDFNQNLNTWDVSAVTNMDTMFGNANSYNQPMNSWTCSALTSANYFLSGADSFNNAIFTNAPVLENVTAFFASANSFNHSSIQNFPVDNGVMKNLTSFFDDAKAFNQDISGWDVSNIEVMDRMFRTTQTLSYQKPVFNQPIGNWDVSKCHSFYQMFYRTDYFQQPLSWSFGTNHTGYQQVSLEEMFMYSKYNAALNSCDVSNVQDYTRMFRNSEFNQPLNNWQIFDGVTQMSYFVTFEEMFASNFVFNQPIGSWNTRQVGNFNRMFDGARVFNQDLSDWWVYAITGTPTLFSYNYATGTVPLSAANTPQWGSDPTTSSRPIKDINGKASNAGGSRWTAGTAKVGNALLRVAGTASLSESIYAASDSDFGFGTGEWCVEFWWYSTGVDYNAGTGGVPDGGTLVDMRSSTNDANAVRIVLDNFNNDNSAYLACYIVNPTSGSTTYRRIRVTQVTTQTWYHIAFQRNSSGVVKLYVNGFDSGASLNSTENMGSAKPIRFGESVAQSEPNRDWWFDEIRVSNTARYTTSFTPTTTPFSNDSNTVLLVHCDRYNGVDTIQDDPR